MQHKIPNTFGFDVKARHLVEFYHEEELPELLSQFPAEEQEHRLWIVGQGSNLLFLKDYEGIILHSNIRGIELLQTSSLTSADVRVGSGVVWDDFVAWTVENGLYGAENLSAIPGEVGAAAVQNIGAYGVEVKDFILEVHGWDIMNQCFRTFRAEDCGYGYRESIFKNPPLHNRFVVTSVTFRLSRVPVFRLDYGNLRSHICGNSAAVNITASAVREAVISIRHQKLPNPETLGNAGSFFKNPVIPQSQFEALQLSWPDIPHYAAGTGLVKVPAAWLIEQCGWKGRSIDGAGVYDKQPLVIVNHGDATPEAIVRLAGAIIASVRERFGITISPEVNYVE